MKILIKDLPEHKKELIGKTINVVSQGGKYHYDYQDRKIMRQITNITTHYEIDKKTGEKIKWITWYWIPQHMTEEETKGIYSNQDCGFAGIGLGSDLWNSRYLEIF